MELLLGGYDLGSLYQVVMALQGDLITTAGTVVMNAGCAVIFVSALGDWGLNYTSFTYQLTEIPQYNYTFLSSSDSNQVSQGQVLMNVAYKRLIPQLTSNLSVTFLEDTPAVEIAIVALGFDNVCFPKMFEIPVLFALCVVVVFQISLVT